MREYTSVCPACGASAYGSIGQLGTRLHYSCRYCGMWWSESVLTGAVVGTSDSEGASHE